MKSVPLLLVLSLAAATPLRASETCITQSQMKPAERDALAQVATTLATRIQANDTAAIRAATIAEYQQDFSGMGDVIASTAPKLAGAQAQVEQVYILDGSTLTKTPAGANPDADFFCNLNKSPSAAEFAIPQLPPGKYAFAMVRMDSAKPWRLSLLLRADNATWQLAGLYPKELTAAGHDGLWYWQQARAFIAAKQPWDAWLYLEQAQSLLTPASFVASSHLDKLSQELSDAVPSAISGGINPDTPLVVKAADGTEFRFTALTVDDSIAADKIDVAAHIKVELPAADATAARKRNIDAMSALLAAQPELRKAFHGVWIFADAPGQPPYATEVAISDLK